MAITFPPDVFVLDTDSLTHVRVESGRRNPRVVRAKRFRLPADTFTQAPVTPHLQQPEELTEVFRRARTEAGRIDRVSMLLPDSWFRINILDLPATTEKHTNPDEVVRWTLKRTLPLRPEDLRIAFQPISKTARNPRALVVAAVEKALHAIELAARAADIEIVLIEAAGLNLWNAIAVREQATSNERMFFYLRDHEFTTAVFRGAEPLFIRSRYLNGQRSIVQEIRLSASFLKNSMDMSKIERCYVAGNDVSPESLRIISEEFGAPVKTMSLDEFAETSALEDRAALQSEVAASTGVFTA